MADEKYMKNENNVLSFSTATCHITCHGHDVVPFSPSPQEEKYFTSIRKSGSVFLLPSNKVMALFAFYTKLFFLYRNFWVV